jgi:hypothetical protein
MPARKRRLMLGLTAMLLVPFIMSSCYKNRFDLENLSTPDSWDPDVCAPLVHSKMTFKDVLNDWDHNNLFVEDGTHFLYIVYWKKVFSRTAAEIIPIPPEQEINSTFQVSVTGSSPLWGNYTAPPYTLSYSFQMPNGATIDKVVLNDIDGGFFHLELSSPNLNQNAIINVSIPAATKVGIPFNQNINYSPGTPANIDLSGYQIVFNNTAPNVNRVDITYTVTVVGTGQPNNSPYTFNLYESFRILSFHLMYGDFKKQSIALPNDTIHLLIFENNVYGSIEFQSASVYIMASNSLGVPIDVSMNNFRALSAINPPYMVQLTGVPNPWPIHAPNLSQIGQTIITDTTISNISVVNAVNMSPQYFITDISGMTNANGLPANNFLVDTNRLAVDAEITLPLHGRAWDFRLTDTIDFSFNDFLDNVEYLSFRISAENGFPVEAIEQIYFLDEQDNVLDSILAPGTQVLLAAPVGPGPDYRVTGKTSKITDAIIEQPRISNLKSVKKVVFYSHCSTIGAQNNQIVKMYSDYYVDVHMSARAKFHVNF